VRQTAGLAPSPGGGGTSLDSGPHISLIVYEVHWSGRRTGFSAAIATTTTAPGMPKAHE
jgi:hypothetical protein